MSKTLGLRWALVIAGATLLALAVACGGEKIVEVEKEVVVEKEVIKEVPVEVERVVEVEKEIVKEVKVEVPVEVVKEVEVIKEVPKVITEEKVVVKEIEVEKVVEVEREVDPRYGGKLVWSPAAAFINSYQTNYGQRETITGIHVLVFDTLMAWDSQQNPTPQMVESFEVKDGAKHFIFTLRDGLKFHNGDTVETSDVVASLQRWVKDDTFRNYITPHLVGDGFTAIDDKSIEVKFSRPNGQFLAQVGKTLQYVPMIMPKEIADIPIDQKLTVEQMIGSGPAVFKEFRELERYVLERFEDYVPRDDPQNGTAGGKRMFFDQIVGVSIPEQEIRVAALETGEVDLLFDVPVQYTERLQDNRDVTVQFGTPGLQVVFQINKHAGVFGDTPSGRLMRQALYVGLDPSDHLNAFTGGTQVWKLCPTMFSCEVWFGGKEIVPGLYNARDIPRAKQMIADAGYKGEEIVVSAPLGGDARSIAAMELLAFKLKERLGLNAKLVYHSGEQMTEWVVPKCADRPVVPGGEPQNWHLGAGAASTWHYRVYSNQWLSKWDWRGCWNNQEFQDLKEELLQELDREKQLEIYNEMQRIFMADPSWIFHGEVPFVHAYDADLRGYKQLTLGGLMTVGMWWDHPDKRR